MSNISLNLARKWRSKNFDQIIGQDLSVTMLKNSLYLGQFFPVYLFSGQRGCGKTSTARIFAAAINCEGLSEFQKNPKGTAIPCLTCRSCLAMQEAKHPDFIEIDAASHTGVDNVRSIIDAASLLPLMGHKKIYLIDEAHMLSKAAFNALLKILEEPPASVLFILATTNVQKIIDTVRSRCFQLFFKPIQAPNLLLHLTNICNAETINYDEHGLGQIIKTTEGSVRDALNLLEQVRFSHGTVSKEAVYEVLGYLDDERLLQLFHLMLSSGLQELLKFLNEVKLGQFSAEFIWYKLVEFLRVSLWLKHGVEPQVGAAEQIAKLKTIVAACSWEQIDAALDLLYSNEILFLKTTAQHAFLEMILLHISKKNKGSENNSGMPSSPAIFQEAAAQPAVSTDDSTESEEQEDEEGDDDQDDSGDVELSCVQRWSSFLGQVQKLDEPLLNSVFKQGKCLGFDEVSGAITVKFSKDLSFFKGWLDDTAKLWLPLLKELFNERATIVASFTAATSATLTSKTSEIVSAPQSSSLSNGVKNASAPAQQRRFPENSFDSSKKKSFTPGRFTANKKQTYGPKEPVVDVSDVQRWPKTQLVLRYFHGVVTEIPESSQLPKCDVVVNEVHEGLHE